MSSTVIVLGASGRFGGHAAAAFDAAGWTVRRFDRGTDNLTSAASGADVIVNAWNPPYHRWASDLPALTAQVIAAARASGATVIIPGNVYVFGAQAPDTLSEHTPHKASNPLGRLRIEMEDAYRAAGVRTIILRAGDFLDTAASGNWFDAIMTRRLARGRLTYPGPLDRRHAWAYLPDVARAAVALAERRGDLDTFEDVPFPGYTLTGQELAALLSQVTGRRIRTRRMAWWPLKMARPVWPLARGLVEMGYLWAMPHALDGGKFERLVPGFAATAPAAAVASAIGERDVHPDEAMARGGRLAAAE